MAVLQRQGASFRKPQKLPILQSGSYVLVTNPTYDPKRLKEYRERAAELLDLSKGVEAGIHTAAEAGNLQASREAFGELQLKTKEFEEFRKTLTPAEIFLAKYNVEIINDHTVSFVVPKGVAPIEILREAQGLVTERNLIWPDQLAKWEKDPLFTTKARASERLCIDGHVPDSINKDYAEQEQMIGKDNLPSLEDLAVAFAACWIATGRPLFGWYGDKADWSYIVRGAGGALDFFSFRLRVSDAVGANYRGDCVAAASYVTSKR
jgi:hypothetical protein